MKEEYPVELHGVFSVRQELQRTLDGILYIFTKVPDECPAVTFIIKS